MFSLCSSFGVGASDAEAGSAEDGLSGASIASRTRFAVANPRGVQETANHCDPLLVGRVCQHPLADHRKSCDRYGLGVRFQLFHESTAEPRRSSPRRGTRWISPRLPPELSDLTTSPTNPLMAPVARSLARRSAASSARVRRDAEVLRGAAWPNPTKTWSPFSSIIL